MCIRDRNCRAAAPNHPTAWALVYSLPVRDDLVHYAVVESLLRSHEVVPFGVFLHLLELLARVLREDLVQALPQAQRFPGMDLDIAGRALESAGHLMDQHL